MVSREERSRLAVVLVGARNPQNIGAVARAMQDFGFSDLRVVNAFEAPFDAAQLEAKSAVGAAEVMRSARRFDHLRDAIEDCTLVAGTTAIGDRGLRRPVVPLCTAVPTLLIELTRVSNSLRDAEVALETPRAAESAGPLPSPPPAPAPAPAPRRVGLLFGSEKTGLTNEQLSYCSLLLTIPMLAPEGRHLSMNLGQAAAVCLYELVREGFEGARELPPFHEASATGADRERLTGLLLETMQRSGYAQRFPGNAREEIVRQLAGGLGQSRTEAATWMGLLRLTLRAMEARRNSEAEPGTH